MDIGTLNIDLDVGREMLERLAKRASLSGSFNSVKGMLGSWSGQQKRKGGSYRPGDIRRNVYGKQLSTDNVKVSALISELATQSAPLRSEVAEDKTAAAEAEPKLQPLVLSDLVAESYQEKCAFLEDVVPTALDYGGKFWLGSGVGQSIGFL